LIRRNLDGKAVLWLSAFGVVGVVLGSWLFTLLVGNASLLGLILDLAFIVPADRMIWEGSGGARKSQQAFVCLTARRQNNLYQ